MQQRKPRADTFLQELPTPILPGEVLIVFRRSRGYMSAADFWEEWQRKDPAKNVPEMRGLTGTTNRTKSVTAFADFTGWNYHKLNRLERIRRDIPVDKWRARFSKEHLNDLVFAEWLEVGDEWYGKFEQSLVAQANWVWQYTNTVRSRSFQSITSEEIKYLVDKAINETLKEDQFGIPEEEVKRILQESLESRMISEIETLLLTLHLLYYEEPQ